VNRVPSAGEPIEGEALVRTRRGNVRILGVITARQIEDSKKEDNDRLLAAAIHSYQHEDLKTIDDVSQTLVVG
jgi:hypothetical protein